MIRSLVIASVVFLLGLTTAEAKLFRNAYISFELPANWNCIREGTEWSCTSKYNRGAKEAVIILAAKEASPTDTFGSFMAYLKAPRTIGKKGGGTLRSKVLHVRQRKISNWDWVDGLHLNGEVGSYYTRYLATLKDRIAIVVSFSAHKMYYTKYSGDFLKAISSLKVVAGKNILSPQANRNSLSNKERIGPPIDASLPVNLATAPYPEEDASPMGGLLGKLLAVAIILAAIGFYLYKKSRTGRKKRSKKR